MQLKAIAVGVVSVVVLIGALWTSVSAFNPQPDPPGFGMVSITENQTLRLNAVCAAHGVGGYPPDPCRATLMFHNSAGEVVNSRAIILQSGEATFLEVGVAPGTAGQRVGIIPCVIPAPKSGRLLPTAEVYDTRSGETSLFINPVAPRLSMVELFRAGQELTTEIRER